MDESFAQTAAPDSTASLLEEVGGEQALDALVGAFYFNLLQDKRVLRFFEDADIETLRNHQRKLFELVLGGKNDYLGRRLDDAHRRLVEERGLDDRHFDAVIEILAATLGDLGYSGELIMRVADRVAAFRDEVLCRGRAAADST